MSWDGIEDFLAPAREPQYWARGDRPDARAFSRALAEQVYSLRFRRGWTQAELAAAAGTTQSAISRCEATASVPTIPLLLRLAAALGVRLEVNLVD
ncbi:MAG: helix-turn-helix domain-containing protein [Thermocrispum sp.]